MRSGNPTLSDNAFSGLGRAQYGEAMTMSGTVIKTALLLGIAFITAGWAWGRYITTGDASSIQMWMWGGVIGGLILALITTFKKEWAPITAPLYAAFEGVFIGAISVVLNAAYPGIALQAASMTFGVLAVMLIAYQTGLVRATEKFKLGVIAATGGIMLVYLISIVLSFFGVSMSFLMGNGITGILFSVFVVIIAALNLVIDFDFIEQGSRAGAPKYMEWYGAFALMVTLVWLYLEILRLLSKLRSR